MPPQKVHLLIPRPPLDHLRAHIDQDIIRFWRCHARGEAEEDGGDEQGLERQGRFEEEGEEGSDGGDGSEVFEGEDGLIRRLVSHMRVGSKSGKKTRKIGRRRGNDVNSCGLPPLVLSTFWAALLVSDLSRRLSGCHEMPRRKPFSAKQRKTQLLNRRALERGEIDALPPKAKPSRRTPNSGTGAEPSSRRLQSRFISVSPAYLALTRDLAHALPLPRPIPASSAEFPIEILVERDGEGRLTCPARPKFKAGQTKKEVERNEEGMFRKWLEGIDGVMKGWVEGDDRECVRDDREGEGGEGGMEGLEQKWPRSTSWFETNLEVWRQL